jgi:hypothetical protein
MLPFKNPTDELRRRRLVVFLAAGLRRLTAPTAAFFLVAGFLDGAII